MPIIRSQISVNTSSFALNREVMLKKVAQVRELEDKVRAASEKKREKFEKRGQLLPRERLAALLDPQSPFLELSTLAGLHMHDDDGDRNIMGGGIITGIGIVSEKRCLVMINDSAIKGGSITPMGLQKALRMQELASKHKIPVVYLVESGGANLLYQSEAFIPGGRNFANQARLSAAGIPQISIVHGSSTAGGAYIPGLSDYVVAVKKRSKIFLAGPPLVKAAIGEETSGEELGGAEMHASVTGLAEYLADDDRQALAYGRDILDKIKWDDVPLYAETKAPNYARDELLGIVPSDEKEPYDILEIIARIVDASDFLEFKSNYGRQTVCGHARIDGRPLGILGNNGPIFPDGSSKAAQFIQLCDQSQTPLLFLQNTTGYMVGKQAEHQGAIKHGSKMIQAVANARVPKITIVVGGSFGAGNYGMCGRGFDPDFIFSWPTARVGVMGGAQAAKVMEIITRSKVERMGATIDENVLSAMSNEVQKQLDHESTALFGTARLWDDGIIDPRDTRDIIITALRIINEGRSRTVSANTFGVARF